MKFEANKKNQYNKILYQQLNFSSIECMTLEIISQNNKPGMGLNSIRQLLADPAFFKVSKEGSLLLIDKPPN